MADTIVYLNFDTSAPSGYSASEVPSQVSGGTIRFLTGADQNSVGAMSRVFGDLMERLKKDESKINEIARLLNSNPALSTFDNSGFVLTNGTHAFTAPITGVTPTAAAHLTTKSYVDTGDAALGTLIQANADDIASLEHLVPHSRQSGWVEHVWNGGVKEYQDLTLSPVITDLSKVVNIVVLEKLNVGTVPSPVWVYRQLMHGTSGDGMRIDDWWLIANNKIRLLVPNTTSYATGYPTDAAYNLTTAVQRFFKAVVTELQ